MGNYANMGLAVEKDGVIYYNKYEKGIVKVKGGKEYQITDETAYSMTVYNDEIYYLTVCIKRWFCFCQHKFISSLSVW